MECLLITARQVGKNYILVWPAVLEVGVKVAARHCSRMCKCCRPLASLGPTVLLAPMRCPPPQRLSTAWLRTLWRASRHTTAPCDPWQQRWVRGVAVSRAASVHCVGAGSMEHCSAFHGTGCARCAGSECLKCARPFLPFHCADGARVDVWRLLRICILQGMDTGGRAAGQPVHAPDRCVAADMHAAGTQLLPTHLALVLTIRLHGFACRDLACVSVCFGSQDTCALHHASTLQA